MTVNDQFQLFSRSFNTELRPLARNQRRQGAMALRDGGCLPRGDLAAELTRGKRALQTWSSESITSELPGRSEAHSIQLMGRPTGNRARRGAVAQGQTTSAVKRTHDRSLRLILVVVTPDPTRADLVSFFSQLDWICPGKVYIAKDSGNPMRSI
jgi:hypothetical protein